MNTSNCDLEAIYKGPVKNEHSDPRFDRLWDLLIPNQTYHVIAIDDDTGGYILEFFDPQIVFEKEAFEIKFSDEYYHSL